MRCNHRISGIGVFVFGTVLLLGPSANAQNTVTSGHAASVSILDSNKEQDGLVGSVRRVQTELAKVEAKSGALTEGPRRLLEVTTYDLKGARIDNASYPVASSPVGKEEYKYDKKGNIIEMTLRGNDGSIISREAYKYEFDRVGNWTKMVTSLVVFEAGELKYEPVESTYRTITYYFDQTISKIIDNESSLTAPNIPASRETTAAKLVEQPLPLSTSTNVADPSLDVAGPPPTPPQHVEVEAASEPQTRLEAESSPGPVDGEAKSTKASLSAATPKTTSPEMKAEPSTGKPSNETNAHKTAFEYYKRGRQRFDSGNLLGAVQEYQQSLQLEPAAEVYLSLGHAYLKLNNSQEAIKAFKESIRMNPEKEEAHYGLGLEYFRTGKNRDAAEAFRRAIRLQPKLAKAHYGLALAYQEMQKRDLLVEQYRILEKLDPALAKKLESTYPQLNWPCRVPPFCQ